ncbi:biotin-dependent carboxyltransferase family protein [Paenalcaligenes niemegkensis]|uniref:5-oxoprolinase subunit C family protein n=1 Tax=Paenalcaligenes niemegkensis TaxID=2895469 RepID=UPI001EE843BD|nr:biotin-dependent carboxyltransferase family protein [Paenalcaligenes niemegkensis]MCQ9618051.1 biotin-dependent carboxyltransferase family protein [Paenalcaligenes niemegkensis]
MTSLYVVSPGIFTTLQDAGRWGYQHLGVPPSGPMDTLLHSLANRLVNNSSDCGALEFTINGGQYRVQDGTCRVAVVGDADLSINGEPVSAWRSYTLGEGTVLRIGSLRTGLRGYLAVAGGFAIQPVLGSVSTLTRAALGGVTGQALKKDDELPLRLHQAPDASCLKTPDGTSLHTLPWHQQQGPFRIVLGPQDDAFTADAIQDFLRGDYKILPASDRMGYRLSGPLIRHHTGHDIISDAIAYGAIQVAGDEQPIIALNDRQTIGGYPKIAVVSRTDLGRLAQLRPGSQLKWRAISVDKAIALWRHTYGVSQQFISRLTPIS